MKSPALPFQNESFPPSTGHTAAASSCAIEVAFGSGRATAEKWYEKKLRRWSDDVKVEPGQTFAGFGFTLAIKSLRDRLIKGEKVELKAIGFTDRIVLFFVLAESLIIALIGGLLGLGLAILAIPVVGSALNGLLPPLLLSAQVLSVGLAFAVLVGAASGLLPGLGAMRLRVVNALRRV